MGRGIYLDTAATTKPSKEVVDLLCEIYDEKYGNASSINNYGVEAAKLVETARRQVAEMINAKPEQIIFTSGGTESNNMALELLSKNRNKAITSQSEHDSIYRWIRESEKVADITTYKTNAEGEAEINWLTEQENAFATITMVDNITGLVKDAEGFIRTCEKNNVPVHVDAVQAAGTEDIDVQKLNCDTLSISGHKINAIKGTGVLYVRDLQSLKCDPLIIGGQNQESGWRGGTQNVPGIAAMGLMCEKIAKAPEAKKAAFMKKAKTFREYFAAYAEKENLRYKFVNVHGQSKILSIIIPMVDGETIVLSLSGEVNISSGSACHSHITEPNRNLIELGYSQEEAMCAVRISFSEDLSEKDLKCAAEQLAKKAGILQRMSEAMNANFNK